MNLRKYKRTASKQRRASPNSTPLTIAPVDELDERNVVPVVVGSGGQEVGWDGVDVKDEENVGATGPKVDGSEGETVTEDICGVITGCGRGDDCEATSPGSGHKSVSFAGGGGVVMLKLFF